MKLVKIYYQRNLKLLGRKSDPSCTTNISFYPIAKLINHRKLVIMHTSSPSHSTIIKIIMKTPATDRHASPYNQVFLILELIHDVCYLVV